MPKIDIGAILRKKAPRLARWIPRPAISWLRRTIHEKEINHILEHYWNLPPQEFIRACFREWQVTYSIEGLEKLDPRGRYIFASNHPFGGMDGMMLADKLIDRFGDARVVVNDLLMHLEPLRPLWIPVNKHGSQSTAYARKFDEEFFGERPILTFPAGLCSRCIDGEVTDPVWKISFLKKAYASQRQDRPGLRRRRAVEILLPRLPDTQGAGNQIQHRDAVASRRDVLAEGQALPHRRRRPDPRGRPATLRIVARTDGRSTRKSVFFEKQTRSPGKVAVKLIFLPRLWNRKRWHPL